MDSLSLVSSIVALHESLAIYLVILSRDEPRFPIRCQSAMEAYRYHPISSPRSIRVLTLYPGDWKADLQLSLSEVSLDDDPVYEALSYTWTDEDANKDPISPIYIESKQLLVTPNCAAALRRLRKGTDGGQQHRPYSKSRRKAARNGGDQARILWIDAICINQADLAERNQQVSIMRDVYGRAACVLVWLGESSCEREPITGYPYTSYALDWITWKGKLLRTKTSLKPVTARLRPAMLRFGGQGHVWMLPCTPLNMKLDPIPAASKALELLFARRWFQRAWVVQEVALAKKSMFICGEGRTDFENLAAIFRNCRGWNELVGVSQPLIRLGYATNLSLDEDPLDGPYLTRLLEFESSDPRDKVFAFYGLGRLRDIFVPMPDYSRSMEEVFSQATTMLVAYAKSLDIFGDAFVHPRDTSLPTWALDWKASEIACMDVRNASRKRSRDASKGSTVELEYIEYSKLVKLRGQVVDRVDISMSIPKSPIRWSYPSTSSRLEASFEVSEWFQSARAKLIHQCGISHDEFARKLLKVLIQDSDVGVADDVILELIACWQLLLQKETTQQLKTIEDLDSCFSRLLSRVSRVWP